MNVLLNIILLLNTDPHSNEFKILLIASEIGVTFIVFYGFYLVFNKFNKNLRQYKQDNPEIDRKKSTGNTDKPEEKDNTNQ
ncbi:MAG: hypothetical protein LC109_06655 [Bacteroidia bacterium]|nr:hypothetical protein [Bacteroidia bacterium]MCO5254314.1 hypothetical protein [Bacteroidota bacterium]MCZ2129933.1 hypothetical protein [Bacteroidia bacterium]